ncbi:MAG TPA: glutaredoxin 3 [Bdellovibrionota bacterium]|jgi:glutaredoxin 3|nr:glutaredoxin 3 [Bdellovibrionota bacterium]
MKSLPIHPKQSPVLIYSKDFCPYCDAAKNLLTQRGVGYEEINISTQPEKRDEMMTRSAPRRTFPQIFVGNEGLGGFDDINALDKAGKLEALLFPNGK